MQNYINFVVIIDERVAKYKLYIIRCILNYIKLD